MSQMLPSDRSALRELFIKRARGEELTESEERLEYSICYMHPLDANRVQDEVREELKNK